MLHGSDRTIKNTGQMSVCVAQGLECGTGVREALTSKPGPTGKNLSGGSDRLTHSNPSTHSISTKALGEGSVIVLDRSVCGCVVWMNIHLVRVSPRLSAANTERTSKYRKTTNSRDLQWKHFKGKLKKGVHN